MIIPLYVKIRINSSLRIKYQIISYLFWFDRNHKSLLFYFLVNNEESQYRIIFVVLIHKCNIEKLKRKKNMSLKTNLFNLIKLCQNNRRLSILILWQNIFKNNIFLLQGISKLKNIFSTWQFDCFRKINLLCKMIL